ncbi:hypothetical protein [Marinoscillum furvescens]|uniref:Uncharacterized protein n=1 Tax=Marinoscillum furvescens DSM 4134 TaxID=1122208 RepID=A0A3D9L5E3_MARFU|nr:hypothetical protein [Marinoscillum furvescens]RED98813.1 hypothetical protein C7460_1094 [Marinoscillum furvescens DSM 4134]
MITLISAISSNLAIAGITEDKSSLKGSSISNNTEEKKSEEPVEEEALSEPSAENSTTASSGGVYHTQAPDSTNLNSVCKFNFIFYFIYKMKYDDAPAGASQLNFEF